MEEQDSTRPNVFQHVEERYSRNAPRITDPRGSLETDPSIISAIHNVIYSPSSNDTPLWRVRCKVPIISTLIFQQLANFKFQIGLEDDIVFFLLQKATPLHELRSTFTRQSIPSWVYLETTMNPQLRNLLQRTPGIIVRNSDIITERIEFKDWLSLLKMRDTKELPKVGKWAEVRKGLYTGDVGCVVSVETWGVQLMLVPRLPPPGPSNILQGKRKRSHPRATPALFDHSVAKQVYGVEPTRRQENCYRFKGNDFEYGLILKAYDFGSISTPVHQVDLALTYLFLESRHPKVISSTSSFPRPLGWVFAQGDKVYVISPWGATEVRRGVITSVLMDSVEVDLGTEEGVVTVSWLDIRKVFSPGDFVEVTSGEHQGRTGWFNGVDGTPWYDTSNVANVIEVRDGDKSLESRTEVSQIRYTFHWCSILPQMFDVHINLLKCVAAPFVLGTQQSPPQRSIPSDKVPWLNTEIIITERHAWKGYRGIILDVLCNQQTSSGLRVQVQLTSLNPNSPFQRILLDYDDIVEAR